MINSKVFETAEQTAAAFGDYLIKQILSKDEYHCALSGGSTPKILFRYLADSYPDSEAWSRVHFYWGDERCVPPTDDESNYKMTKELLLDKVPIPEENIHRIIGENDPSEEAVRYGKELLAFLPVTNKLPIFDMNILGMGGDGHTASIFPHQIELLKSSNICDVAKHPESGQYRVTLSGPVINAAVETVFLVTGKGKAEIVNQISNKTGNWESYPAAHIGGNVIWFLDEAASGKSI